MAVCTAMRSFAVLFCLFILPAIAADAPPEFDASLLKEGRFIYRTTLGGEPLGEMALEIRRAGSHYRITMSAPEIAQSWEAVVDRAFAPRSARLGMRTRSGPYEMKLQYANGAVNGEERRGDSIAPVKATLEGLVLDQRVDWAAVMALKSPPQGSFELQVFDPSTGSSRMLGRIGGGQPLSGAWGEAPALRLDYSIYKVDHVEEYTVYATRDTPRYMLREDMPNGLVAELVRMEP